MYGSVRINGLIYKAKTTIKEYRNKDNKVYDYKITKVELIISGPSTDNALNNSTFISAAKVLKDIEKSYDKGKYFLDESDKATPRDMGERIQSIAEKLNIRNLEIVTDTSALEWNRKKSKGFFSKRTGKITIVLPNHSSIFDAEQTLLHEGCELLSNYCIFDI